MEKLPGRCPHCGGTLFIEDGVNKCLACSREVEGPQAMYRYYEYNKEAIMASMEEVGIKKTTVKWKIPPGSIEKLRRRWSKNGTPEPGQAILPDGSAGPYGLPPWSDSWPYAVMLQWLEYWFYFKIKEKEEG